MHDSRFVFTSESVTEGHPDKLCDRMSDAIVGHHVALDPAARVVAECPVSTGIVFVSVKLRSRARVDETRLVLGAYGHVGRTDLALPWERTDRIDALRG